MDAKLTLKLDEQVIERAKDFARKQKTSLSRLIENYLQSITDNEDKDERITPLVKSLSGIIKLPEDYDHKQGYADYLSQKYR